MFSSNACIFCLYFTIRSPRIFTAYTVGGKRKGFWVIARAHTLINNDFKEREREKERERPNEESI